MWLPNKDFLEEMSADSDFRAELERQGELVASRARSFVADDSGEYDRRVAVLNRPGEPVTVAAFAPYSHILEWGSRFVPPQAPLRRAVRSAGLRLDETPR